MNDDPYSDAIMDLAHKQSGHGRLADPRSSATLDNPLCGDRVTIDVEWTNEGTLKQVAHVVRGCALCLAAASVIGDGAPGKSINELAEAVNELKRFLRDEKTQSLRIWPDLAVFKPIRSHKSRFDCVLLPFAALLKGLGVSEGADQGQVVPTDSTQTTKEP